MAWVTKIINATTTTSVVGHGRTIAAKAPTDAQYFGPFGTYISYDGIAYASLFSADDTEFNYPLYRSFVSSTLSEAGFKLTNLNARVLDWGDYATVREITHSPSAIYCGTYEEVVAIGADGEINSFHFDGNQFPPFYKGIKPKGKEGSTGIDLTQNSYTAYIGLDVTTQYVSGTAYAGSSFKAAKSYKNYFGANADTNEIYMVLWDTDLGRVVSLTYMAPIRQNENYTGDFPTKYGVLQVNTNADNSFSITLSTPVFTGSSITSYHAHSIVTSTMGNVASSGFLQDIVTTGLANGIGKNLSPIYLNYSNNDASAFITGKFGNVLFGSSAGSNFAVGEDIGGYHVFPSKYMNFPTIAVPVDKVSSYTPPVIPIKLAPPEPPVIPDPITNQPKVNPNGTDYSALYSQYRSMCLAYANSVASYWASQIALGNFSDLQIMNNPQAFIDEQRNNAYNSKMALFNGWAADPNRPSTL